MIIYYFLFNIVKAAENISFCTLFSENKNDNLMFVSFV